MSHTVKVLLNKEQILEIVRRLAKQLIENNKNKKELNWVIVLEGAKTFANELTKEILKLKKFKVNNYFVKMASYGSGTESSGKIEVKKGIEDDVSNKDLVIIEDIVDTGLTLSFLKGYLVDKKKAKSVKICSLLDKPARRKVNLSVDYIGYEVPNLFIVGYGIDYAGKYRELEYVGYLEDS